MSAARVLVLNCGSSSVKYRLVEPETGAAPCGGIVERLGEASPAMRAWALEASGRTVSTERQVASGDHRAALALVAAALADTGMLDPGDPLTAVGHRVVHGGAAFSRPTPIDDDTVRAIRDLAALAPLHNPANALGIEVARETWPGVPHVAVFDTAFHRTLPPAAYRYAVPEPWFRDLGVRRYGFHGSSHAYVAGRAAELLGRPAEAVDLVTLHLGNGASACAVKGGVSVDTSMGLTPLEGLVMGTRSGDIDPAVPLLVQRRTGAPPESVEAELEHRAGLAALGGTNDMRELLARRSAGDEAAALAVDVFVHRLRRYIGAFMAVLGSADALVFTGGIGENAPLVRELACAGLERLGIALDPEANAAGMGAGREAEIGRPGMPVRVWAVRTDEELQIAREALAAVRR